jgi:NAD(P)-dependent dehydrogenase (short-subunit alcohol dehydrogenase family)
MMIWGPKTSKRCSKVVGKSSFYYHQDRPILGPFFAGHYLMTELLLEKMIETAEQTGIQGRIINLSSVIHSWVKRDAFCLQKMLSPKK